MAANVILFVLGTILMSSTIQAGVVFFGLFAIVFSYSFWLIVSSNSGWFGLTQEILKTLVVLVALLGIAVALQGLGGLTALEAPSALGCL